MAQVEYKVTYLKRMTLPEFERFLNYLNETERWELVTLIRGRPTKVDPVGRMLAVFKRPIQ
jgi:hypothetical protein